MVGVIGTTWGLIEANRQRGIAVSEAFEKDKARIAESEQRKHAEKRLGQVSKMNQILCMIFQDIDPQGAEKEGRRLASVLEERVAGAAADVESRGHGRPARPGEDGTDARQGPTQSGVSEKVAHPARQGPCRLLITTRPRPSRHAQIPAQPRDRLRRRRAD